MTPSDLREKALNTLWSAKKLIEEEYFDNASYLTGYAVEYALKARYCTRNGLNEFPRDKKQAKELGITEIITHDLNNLLKLSNEVRILESSYSNINWEQAKDWTSEQRYQPIGQLTKKKTLAQFDETCKLVRELAIYEFIAEILPLEKELTIEKGPFNLFFIGENILRLEGWRLLLFS